MGTPVLYVHGIAAIGGAERDLLALLRMLNRNTWSPIVVCPESGPLREQVESLGIPVHSMELPPWRKLFGLMSRRASVRRLRALVDTLQPVLIHVNDIWWVPHVIHACEPHPIPRIPVVAHVRQEIEPAKVSRYALEQVDSVLAVSAQVQRSLEAGGVASDRVKTVYSGIDLEALGDRQQTRNIRVQYGIPPTAPLLGTVANLFPRKGYDTMLRALPLILDRVPDVQYVIVGTGEEAYTRQMRKLSRDLGVSNRVHFAGFQEDVFSYLAAVDIYVHPALMEGFGIAVVEAMAIGKPVVATTTGGLPEVVAHNKTGLLVAPGDPQAFGVAIVELLQDSNRRIRMGAAGRIRVNERFSLAGAVAQIEAVYGACVGAAAGGVHADRH